MDLTRLAAGCRTAEIVADFCGGVAEEACIINCEGCRVAILSDLVIFHRPIALRAGHDARLPFFVVDGSADVRFDAFETSVGGVITLETHGEFIEGLGIGANGAIFGRAGKYCREQLVSMYWEGDGKRSTEEGEDGFLVLSPDKGVATLPRGRGMLTGPCATTNAEETVCRGLLFRPVCWTGFQKSSAEGRSQK